MNTTTTTDDSPHDDDPVTVAHRTPDELQPGTLTDIGDRLYPYFEHTFENKTAFSDVQQKLEKARYGITKRQILSKSLGIAAVTATIIGIIAFTAVVLALTVFNVTVPSFGVSMPNETLATVFGLLRTPVTLLVTATIATVIGAVTGFAVPVIRTYLRISFRTNEINTLLPDAISYMYSLSEGGMSHLEIMESLADSEDVYGELAHEYKIILQDMRLLDVDYRTAIRNRALETPSEPLSEFLTDMLSIIDSGGDMSGFLEDKKEKHMKAVQDRQERTLDQLDLFGEMYLTISIFPILIIIVFIILQLMGNNTNTMLALTIYGLIPTLAVAFLVLISAFNTDEVGGAVIDNDTPDANEINATYDSPVTEEYKDRNAFLNAVYKQERLHAAITFLKNPWTYFTRGKPTHIFGLTIPLTIGYLIIMYQNFAAQTLDAFINQYYWNTVAYFYIPFFIAVIPYVIAYERYYRHRFGITNNWTESLRKLGSANSTGLTLLESFRTVADTTDGTLGEEYQEIYRKVQFGERLDDALIEFNNRYQIPTLARTIHLIADASKTSNQISSVLTVAAEISENQDDMEQARLNQTMQQSAVIVMTSVVFLGVLLILQTQFLAVFADMPSVSGDTAEQMSGAMSFNSLNTTLIGMFLFHAVTLQTISAGVLATYMRHNTIKLAGRYLVPLLLIAMTAWGVFAG